MIGLLQRVTQAQVTINGDTVASINTGLLVLVGVEKNDSEKQAERLIEKLINYRVFPDDQDKMNLSLQGDQGRFIACPSIHTGS